MMARAALVARARIAEGETDPFYATKISTAVFYAAHVLVAAPGLAQVVIAGGASGLAIPEDLL